jgi:RNA polymerase sigma factor (TIGR02999 family)
MSQQACKGTEGSDGVADTPGDRAAAAAATLTRLLNEAGTGDARSSAELLPLVYEQLRAMAAQKMRRESADHTLQATALVHEAFLRLVDHAGGGGRQWDGRWHFFGAAAEAMRRILVENARRRGRLKRGAGLEHVSLDDIDLAVDDPSPDLLALDEALLELEQQHPEKAQLVKLRYFAGLTMDEAAQAIGISPRSAGRAWSYARAWLYTRINPSDKQGAEP